MTDEMASERVMLDDIDISDELKARCMSDEAQDRATSIKEIGLLHPPILWKRDGKLSIISGRDRIAAHLILGLNFIDVRIYEGDDMGARKIEAHENAQRRHDPEEKKRLIAELVELAEREVKLPPRTGKPGRPKSKRGAAVKQVAKTMGMSERAVQNAVYDTPPAPEGPPIDTLGMDLSEDFLRDVAVAKDWFSYAATRATSIYSISDVMKAVKAPRGPMARILEDAKMLADLIRSIAPVSLCPWCKGVDGYQDKCPACSGCGWVGKAAIESCPAKLLDKDRPIIMSEGEEVPIDVAVDGELW